MSKRAGIGAERVEVGTKWTECPVATGEGLFVGHGGHVDVFQTEDVHLQSREGYSSG
jgi:hypothetical protein